MDPQILLFLLSFQMESGQKQTKLNSKTSLLCICFSLLAFIITFLSGVQNSGPEDGTEELPSDRNQILDSELHVEPDHGSCTAVTALLHFFLLATFSWNSLYGTQVVLLVRSMQRSLPSYWTRLSWGVGWGTTFQPNISTFYFLFCLFKTCRNCLQK